MNTQEKQQEIQKKKIEWVKPELKTLGTVKIAFGEDPVCTPGSFAIITCYIGTSVGSTG